MDQIAARSSMLLVSEPSLGEDEKAALVDVIDGNWITMGGRVQAFEQAFAQQHGAAGAVAVNNCTAGLHLALYALGVGPGDEVLVPSLTFVATANSVIYAGAKPVFVDVESLDMPVMSLADAAAKCTPRTKAVMVMHYAGHVRNPGAWREFAESRGLHLIEDSAHAVGAARGEVFGDAAVFSFFGNKNMTTAEGGMVIARDPEVLSRVRQARSHGMTSTTVQRLSGQVVTYDVPMLGFNYRMDEMCAAIGLVQLAKLGSWNSKRKALAGEYRALIRQLCPRVEMPFADSLVSSHHILPVLLPRSADRQAVVNKLRERGVQTSFHYPPVHRLSYYRDRSFGTRLPHTEEFAARELTLPLHPKMEMWQVEFVLGSLAEALAH